MNPSPFRELFTKEVALKLANGDCLEESLTVSVSPTGKEKCKTVRCEDDSSLSISFGCRYIKFHLSSFVEEPSSKRVCPDRYCAYETLLQNAAKRDRVLSTRPVVSRLDAKQALFIL